MTDAERLTALEATLADKRQIWHTVNNQLQSVAGGYEMVREMQELHIANGQKIDAIIERNILADAAIKKLSDAFPEGDIEGHRDYHRAVIEMHKLRSQIFREAILKLGQVGIFGAIALLAAVAWKTLKLQITQ